MPDRFVVVGGDAAGMSAAGKARRDDPDREIVVVERGQWAAYGACGLPYYEAGVIEDVAELVVVEPETFVEDRDIDLRLGHEAVALDVEDQTVTVEAADDRYALAYDDLLVATGGDARRPDVPGADLTGVFAVRNLEAGRALHDYLRGDETDPTSDPPGPTVPLERPAVSRGPPDHVRDDLRGLVADRSPRVAAVVGANKIGLEMAAALDARGLEVHVFEAGPTVLPLFGPDVGSVVERRLREQGLTLHLEAPVERFAGEDGRLVAVETGDARVPVDVAVADVGVSPNASLAASAGLELGASDAIATDDYGRTSAPAVYAAGDCAEIHHLLADRRVHWPYALAANRAGRAVGRTVAGRPTRVGPVVGTAVAETADLEVARTGLLDADARAAGADPVSTAVTTITRAHYYPGWSRMVVHMTGDRDGRLLGASLVAAEGAAHRIDAVATALHAGLSVRDFGDLDFGYAPPFGPVWDPLLLAAKSLGETLEPAAGE